MTAMGPSGGTHAIRLLKFLQLEIGEREKKKRALWLTTLHVPSLTLFYRRHRAGVQYLQD